MSQTNLRDPQHGSEPADVSGLVFDRPGPATAGDCSTTQERAGGHARPAHAPDERSEAEACAVAVASPRPVTRGESSRGSGVQVDWLNCTFGDPGLSRADFIERLAVLLGRPVFGVEGKGLIGFSHSVTLYARHGSKSSHIGAIAYGGESQAGRWLLQLTGVGCQLVRDWPAVQRFLSFLGARITRVDLALDFLHGEYTVDDAVTLYQTGQFQLGGRPPSSSVAGDWLGGSDGRTLYVGKSANGKMLRVYEKGKQLGDASSAWTRFEVQLGSRDRVIPLAVLTNRDQYFAGCYPALKSMIQAAAEAVPTLSKSGETSLVNLFYHLKRCYGKAIDTFVSDAGAPIADLVEELRVIGLPRRVSVSSVAAGVNWSDVIDQYKRVAS